MDPPKGKLHFEQAIERVQFSASTYYMQETPLFTTSTGITLSTFLEQNPNLLFLQISLPADFSSES
jgi:hypothetical protein